MARKLSRHLIWTNSAGGPELVGDYMNTATYEALRRVGATEEQAVVIATAIPDVERPIADLRTELKELELRFVTGQRNQTRWLAGLIVTVLLAVIASNFF